ncbi:MAG: 4Fe-4S dicluster domain-containing protein [Acidimicrobiia bacterium]|nr:4Fe-4S dicluster domain-containing protein [Acidimicrobiia bacterium]
MTTLGLDPDELAGCVGCGLCLPHCPTYRVSGEEAASPRGRIALMRVVEQDGAPADDAFAGFMDACVQCRGCEAACPSGVQFGHLIAGTRASLTAVRPGSVPRWMRLALRGLGHPRLLRAGSRALAAGQRLGVVPSARFGLPAKLPLRARPLQPTGTDVWLFTGCVMDAWLRPTHAAVKAVVEQTGAGVALPGGSAGCCGALHEHAGLRPDALALAQRTMSAFPGDAPILVDSAGCGAMLESYGELLGTPEAARFSARVLDVHEWLAERLDRLPDPVAPVPGPVAIQDPCHLRHVQRAHVAVHTVLARYVTDLRTLDDEGLCCGAGGAYAVVHPETAAAIRERKLASIERSGADLVASANPGCALHLAAGGAQVVHPLELVARALALDVRG